MRQYFLNHHRLFNHGNQFQLAAARASLNIDVEHALKQPRPRHAHGFAGFVRAIALALGAATTEYLP